MPSPTAPAERSNFFRTALMPLVTGLGAAILCLSFLECTKPAWIGLFQIWMTSADYSHGVFVPIFAAACFWSRWRAAREEAIVVSASAFVVGLLLLALAGFMTCAGIYCRMLSVEGFAILAYLGGMALCCLGWRAIPIAGPPILFLVFMIPLPRAMGLLMSSSLQHLATVASTYVLQTLGMPAVAEGNVIHLSQTSLGIAEACSGIRMLISFFALTIATCLIMDRSWIEKAILCLSAPVIAVAVNLLRITATGLAYEYGEAELAERIFHDFAGWMMMPAGLILVWVELILLTRVFPKDSTDQDLLVLTPGSTLAVPLAGGQMARGH